MKKSVIPLFINSSLLMMISAIVSIRVNAHPGHDHHHWSSEIHHVLGWLGIFVGLSFLLYSLFKARQVKCIKLHEER
jgi:hypothetical protein